MSIAPLSREHINLLDRYADQVPDKFKCPISTQPMIDPISHKEGCQGSFDAAQLLAWVQRTPVCPNDRAQVSMADFAPNFDLRNEIREFCEQTLMRLKQQDDEIAALRAQLGGAPSAPPLSDEDAEVYHAPAPSAPPPPQENPAVFRVPANGVYGRDAIVDLERGVIEYQPSKLCPTTTVYRLSADDVQRHRIDPRLAMNHGMIKPVPNRTRVPAY